jgi:hypothetical protein
MRVIIYVEGRSDRDAMEQHLAGVIEDRRLKGIAIEFFDIPPSGHNKRTLLKTVPVKAVNILGNDPEAIVIALPDLYPRDIFFPHSTFLELEAGLKTQFEEALRNKKREGDARILQRFRVFCFKHDLEALVLAAEEQLASRLGVEVNAWKARWTRPVEDQNHNQPPKRIVEALFEERGEVYRGTVDTPLILACTPPEMTVERCPQCFAPFVAFLQSL